MIAVITAGLSILAIILEMIIQYRQDPARGKEVTDEKTQRGRQDIQNGNVDAIEQRIDGLLNNTTGNSNAREQSSEDISRRISKL